MRVYAERLIKHFNKKHLYKKFRALFMSEDTIEQRVTV
ncbi:hypothetical protein Mpsy_2581 [Methanolobus psychrophilus R15]|nr:hypothetical protein Mpsy_2581 [Methanolobus psychrophilus R15]